MTTKTPKNVTPAKFAKWLKRNIDCEAIVRRGERVEAVVYADHIEPGKCVPLVAEMDDEILMITEFTNDYYYPQAAKRAIEKGEDAYSPVPFYEWVQDQYLTVKDVKITKVEI
ncbi:MAG: hypothetical protein GX808_04730 [Syntrophomonadaceae bacterium]|jgi:hypothetical protein|nr:hypothetical protein [Syntrophomonadaceae bacterium]